MHPEYLNTSSGFSASERALLGELGLSKHEVHLYGLLTQSDKSQSVNQLALAMNTYPTALYRLLKELEGRGLIQKISSRPQTYKALQKQIGLNVAFQQHQSKLKRLLSDATSQQSESVDIVMGRSEMYDAYIEYASKAIKSIDVFAIGIAYNHELRTTQEEALKRGVRIRHVVQKVRPQNFHVIHAWVTLGVQMRYLPEDQGYHLIVIDDSTVLITFSDPENTEERLTIISKHPTALKLFINQFALIWQSSGVIPVQKKSES